MCSSPRPTAPRATPAPSCSWHRSAARRVASSTFAVEEAARNLRLKAPAEESELVILMGSITLAGGPDRRTLERASRHGLPEKDVPILAAAIAIRANLLVTGDRRHFGRLFGKKVDGVEILPPAAALVRLLRPRCSSELAS